MTKYSAIVDDFQASELLARFGSGLLQWEREGNSLVFLEKTTKL